MTWSQVGAVLGALSIVSGAIWKLASAWTKKAIAIGLKAAAEQEKERQIAELRRSHEKFMERWSELEKKVVGVEKDVSVLTAKVDERERYRRDTQGIVVRGDGE